MSNSGIPGESFSKAFVVFAMWAVSSPCWNHKCFQVLSNGEMKLLITFHINCLLRKHLWHYAPHTSFQWMQRSFVHCMWFFSTLQSTVQAVYVTTWVELHFVRKNKSSNTWTSSCTHWQKPWQCWIVAAGALTTISSVWSLDEHLSEII
jgi:hypothetical protein